ncbi:hypothetical protein RUND412_000069 [Rhizina undulata]
MCILLLTTAHPEYPLILLNNRDVEFLHRPTAPATFWEALHTHILSGRDLARPERGTWLGITRSGRIAVLTNYRESSSAAAFGIKSRGAIVTSFLTSTEACSTSTKNWIRKLLADGELEGVGGFSLFCGILRPDNEAGELKKFAVISNRTASGEDGVEEGAHWIAGSPGETHGLSNSLFEHPWPKVTLGRQLLENVVAEAVENGEGEEKLLERLFGVLSHDTLPRPDGENTYANDLEALRHSVFIPTFVLCKESPTAPDSMQEPPTVGEKDDVETLCTTPVKTRTDNTTNIQDSSRLYGTHKQTVILVDRRGRLKYIERTLYDDDAQPVGEDKRDIMWEFDVEGWNS